MAIELCFTEDELAIDEGLGYPKAYSKLCRDRSFNSFSNGPPFTFAPYTLPQIEASRTNELDEMFPIIDPRAKPTTKPKIFVSLLWKQLNHLGNAGFDPETFRVDPYGNVLYYHADPASPLAWDIDHWFPCSRGGLTVASNLRILQWQVCRKKHDQLEFLIPWWDLQVGVSINQFLSIFASSNSDFRHRAFSWLFSEGECEEINSSQTVDSHAFPRHFLESKDKIGLAPAAIVLSRREHHDNSSLDFNKKPKSSTPIIAVKKLKSRMKENEDPNMMSNPYEAIVLARDSLRHREETSKMKGEIQKLDDEVNELKRKTEDEKFSIQELEMVLIKRKRRVEKCRRLAEEQSSYRVMLEKMIRDAMHQSVVYKEQVRLNQAASNALMARLEAQKAICDSSERDLYRRFKKRDELEKQVRPHWEKKVRKRSRIEEKDDNKIVVYSPKKNSQILEIEEANDVTSLQLHKELRVYLDEEQKKSAELSLEEEKELEERCKIVPEEIVNEGEKIYDNFQFPVLSGPEKEEDEESRKERGKGNVEKWLELLLDSENRDDCEAKTEEIIRKLNIVYPQKDKNSRDEEEKGKEEIVVMKARKSTSDLGKREILEMKDLSVEKSNENEVGDNEGKENMEKGKERVLVRCESARLFRRKPSSPSLIFNGMKKKVDCIGKKPLVMSDEDGSNKENEARNSFIKSSFKTIKRAVKM